MEPWLEAFARANFLRSADTAHDLKTPLNVAVLNLELLRMRLAKIGDNAKDEKVEAYATAIETELRRMARIFDAFFLLSTPPKDEKAPASVALPPLLAEFDVAFAGDANVICHESRIRQALKMFFEGASKVLKAERRQAKAEARGNRLDISVGGQPEADDFEVAKIFKFYYTDPAGNPDLSLAAARLIAETYGGELSAEQERDKVIIRLSLPLGDR
jgi:signal transduction histidine kinase